MWEYRAALRPGPVPEAVHDGDTLRLLVDLGFDAHHAVDVRLSDVRAPEMSQVGGTETRAFVIDWLGHTLKSGFAAPYRRWPLRVRTEITRKAEPTEIRSFTRYVGMVYNIESGECLNDVVNRYLAQHPEWPVGKEA